MIELLVVLTFIGLIISCQRRLGLANPFQIYFFCWFLVFFGYYFYQESFLKISIEVFMMLLVAKCLALLFLVVASISSKNNYLPRSIPIELRADRILSIAQIVVSVGVPFAYMKAMSLSDGNDIFSVIGYIRLRSTMTEDGDGFGVLSYFFILSYIVTSVSVVLFATKRMGSVRLIVSIMVSIFYAYLSTGRTQFLLLLLLLLIPLILMRFLRLKGVFVAILLFVVVFVFVAGMTAKGISVDSGIGENIETFSSNIRGYTVAPLLAFSQFSITNFPIELGKHSFRSFFAFAYALGITEIPPVLLIKEYSFVPDATNVYTVYETYLRDFWYFGIFIPPAFLLFHWWLYKNARYCGGAYVFFYAASTFPLLMQFFQDQYFSLLSTWVQVTVWYWVLLKSKRG